MKAAEDSSLLHVHCGECSAQSLRSSGVGGEVIVWDDPLIEGPAPADVSPTDWLRLRAENLRRFFPTEADAVRAIAGMDERLCRFRAFDEVVLWFDACLFDQIILIRQLHWFAREGLGDCKLSLICIGEFPGFAHFQGLGELNPPDLASLLPLRHEVSDAETALAIQAWAAYRAPDPTGIERLLQDDTSVLPYLGPALRRHLERFPSRRNGLSRLEGEALAAIASGEQCLWAIMRAAAEREYPAFFGDAYLFALLEALTCAPHPLLLEEGLSSFRHMPQRDWPLINARYTLTDDGKAVLDGEADWIALHGHIDRWLGGVHLLGADSPWRWDGERGRLVRSLS